MLPIVAEMVSIIDLYVRLIVHGDEKLLIPDEINLHIKAFQLAARMPCIIKSMNPFPTKIHNNIITL